MKCPNKLCHFETERGQHAPNVCPISNAKMPKRVRRKGKEKEIKETPQNKDSISNKNNISKIVELEDDIFSVWHWKDYR